MLFRSVKKESRNTIHEAIHVNNTARVQSVTRESNAKFYQLISAFKKKTGIAALLNTSFNERGQPMVNTPSDGIKVFFSTPLDLLVIGNYVIRK